MAGLAGCAFDDRTITQTGTVWLVRGSMTQKPVGWFASSVPFFETRSSEGVLQKGDRQPVKISGLARERFG
jgi:hypothetical protein